MSALLLLGMLGVLVASSLGVWGWALSRRSQHGSILPRAPRAPVPWGPLGAIVALGLVGLSIAGFLLEATDRQSPQEAMSADEFVTSAVIWSTFTLAFVALVLAWIINVNRATRRDLGWPNSADATARDIGLGLVGCVAALAPVLLVQGTLVWVLDQPSTHPVLQMLQESPSPKVMLAATYAATVAAPIFEEILFRQLLQGWLERQEDQAIGLIPEDGLAMPVESEESGEEPFAEATSRESLDGPRTDNPYRSPLLPPGDTPGDITAPAEQLTSEAEPPAKGLWGLPYGSVPLVASSLLFALAHLGHGPDPIPLFLLGLVLGYFYQRTHRILPCIVLHMTFNAFSLSLLWLQPAPQG